MRERVPHQVAGPEVGVGQGDLQSGHDDFHGVGQPRPQGFDVLQGEGLAEDVDVVPSDGEVVQGVSDGDAAGVLGVEGVVPVVQDQAEAGFLGGAD
ncbi:hypothetical protein V519_037805 [Streptomyces rimosus R6-500]|nr:hypothetical protein V519_037805 [Streptomyces rimosus R6-500]